MKILRPLLIIVLLVIIIGVILIWWNQPARVDMADYVPADSLVYIEVNSLTDVTQAIQETDAWKAAADIAGFSNKPQSRFALFAAKSGFGPVEGVISTRAQMALAIVGVDTAEKEDSLRIKPEVAVVVETKTSQWRMKSSVKKNLMRLANFAYGSADCKERSADAEYVECVETKGSRKLIGAIDGTAVIIGNSDKAVQGCLQVRRGQRPSLHTNQEFISTRTGMKGDAALAFGFVSQANSAKLFSWGAPLLLGKAPGDPQVEQMLSNSAAKILRGVAWTSNRAGGKIEDRYQIALDDEVVKRLEPAFANSNVSPDYGKLLPDAFRSFTVYKTKDPQTAWFSLDSAVAMKLDAVSTMLFASLLRSSLTVYGIENPKDFLAALEAPLVTLRPVLGESSLLIAKIKDETQLRKALAADLLKENKGQILNGTQTDPDKEKEFAAVISEGDLVIGKSDNVAVYLAQLRNHEMMKPDRVTELKLNNQDSPTVLSFTSERDSIVSVIVVLSSLRGQTLSDSQLEEIRKRLRTSDVSTTESILNSTGIERRSLSAFGQFGSLLSLAQADSSATSIR
ncbi:MAG TPA: hypothetical protein VI306_03575 [Pyrinomonadaceae bacterium]